ncbi:MAG: YdcF family protein [Pseudomonadales bacterium]|jgi:SanA protein|nr:YdcF family protein [Pseudomonadales bacterium]
MLRKIIYWLAVISINLILAVVIVVIAINVWVVVSTRNKTYDCIEEIPERRVGLVLGTTSSYDGRPNAYFVNRIQATADLFHAGKISYIIVSGDNETIYYNEPRDMRLALLQHGIPSGRIYLDYAGFRTLDSVIRAREIFGETELIVISQEFHNQRAIVIGRHHDIDLIGFNAQDLPLRQGWRIQVREIFSRVQMFWDLYTYRQPRFLGERIDIG